jgi:hypothetical protein
MPNYKERICGICKELYLPTSPKQKYCEKCKNDGRKLADRKRDKKRSRDKYDYKEFVKICPVCKKEFLTFYSKKVYCGSEICDKERISIKNHIIHLRRDKEELSAKGKKYYYSNKERSCSHKAEKYRELNPEAKEYVPGRVYKHNIEYVREYVEYFGYKLLSKEYVNSKEKILLQCPKGHEWETTFHCFRDTPNLRGNRCLQCYISNNYVSKLEQKIRDYIETNFNDLEVIYNDRTILYPKELDFYFPNHNLAIEVCGLYWHSDTANGIERSYHYNKMMQCHAKGIRLITIFEDEINNKFDLVMSRIKQALGIIESRIYARKCDIKSVSNKVANDFFDSNHIQGSSSCKTAFGLFYNNNMVACCSVGTITRKNANLGNTLELKRFCCIKDTTVVGGAGKLFKKVLEFARNNEYCNIKSYCDMRYANIFKPVYEIIGFKLLISTKYTPHYFIGGVRYRNMSLRKTPEERLTGKSELELRLEQGYNRIWDCGHRTYIMGL